MDWAIEKNEQDQGSQAWHLWRSQGIGSSEAAVLIGASPYKTLTELWKEKTGEPSKFQGNFHTERGQRLEPVVRAMKWDAWKPETRVHADYTWMRGSCDGWNPETRTLIEIKCPMTKPHEVVPAHYMPQCQWLIEIFQASGLEYISYVEGYEPVMIRVERDDKMISELIEKGIWFWNLVQSKTPPYDTDLEGLAKAYKAVKFSADALDEEITALKNEMKALITDQGADVGGLRMQWITSKGAVDYAKIPELMNIDLEKYRKASFIKFDVRGIK